MGFIGTQPCRGPGARTMSAGSLGRGKSAEKDSSFFPPQEAGLLIPAPSTEKAPPLDAQRSALAPGPGWYSNFCN